MAEIFCFFFRLVTKKKQQEIITRIALHCNNLLGYDLQNTTHPSSKHRERVGNKHQPGDMLIRQ